ncbi:MAG: sulfatase [Deltaproteobacteria bacterium]|nr:sulfatase [Deltaproteobacteria bacterium]
MFIKAPPTSQRIEVILQMRPGRSQNAPEFPTTPAPCARERDQTLLLGLLLAATLLGVACSAGKTVVTEEEISSRPNIVVLVSDDQAFDTMGHAGQPWLRTPGMDRLAAEGARFTRAFVTTSLCSPSRASFLSGRWARSHGIINNGTEFPSGLPTFASELQAAGYDTAYIGKWHMNRQKERPGFDFSASYLAQGEHQDTSFMVNGEFVETEGWVDDVATDYALEFLRSERDAPFLLFVGFKSPHAPWEPPERLLDLYRDARQTPPANIAAIPPYPRTHELKFLAAKGIPTRPYRVPENWVELLGKARKTAQPGEGANWIRKHRRAYHQLIAGVDENVVRLLETLDELDLTKNTIVVYSSDNGWCNGAHGIMIKRAAYEESIRVPLLVRYPPLTKAGTTIDKLVLNVDLAPTLLDLAGVKAPDEMQGRSLVPLLAGNETEWRTSFVYENFYEPPFYIPTLYALRTETWKLVEYPGYPGWTEFFHLAEDPYETENLATSEAHAATLAVLRAELAERARVIGPRPPGFE